MATADSCDALMDEGSLSRVQLKSLQGLVIVSAVLSLFGSSFIIITHHVLGVNHRPPAMRVIYCLSGCDLVLSVVYLIDAATDTLVDGCGAAPGCRFLGACQQYFGLAAISWTVCLAATLHLSVLRGSSLASSPSLLRRMHVSVWALSLGSVVLLGATDTFGVAGQWCWVRREAGWARLLFFYLPMVAAMVYTLTIYLLVHRRLAALRQAVLKPSADAGASGAAAPADTMGAEVTLRARNYLLVYLVINLFRASNRLQNLFSPQPVYVLYALHSIFEPLQGVGNALIYGNTPRVRALLSRLAARYGCADEEVPVGGASQRGPPAGPTTELAVSTAPL